MAPVGPAGGPAESQADAWATRVMAGATPAASASPEPARDGTPLPGLLRAFYEPRFGRSLADIRLHTGPQAQARTAALAAHAFTHDRHVWLGRGRAAVPSRTVAHELAHALQHDRHTVWREPYETRGVDLSRTDIATMSTRGYWTQRTAASYAVSLDSRLTSDPEERDAVLSVLWSLVPAALRTHRVMTVPIAARTLPAPAATAGAPAAPPAATQTRELLYRFVFDPPAEAGALPRLSVEFVTSATGLNPVAASAAPAGFVPSTPNAWRQQGFPSPATGSQPDEYWAQHPAEHAALFNWIENTAPATFSQLVTTASGSGRSAHTSAFHVSGRHTGSTIATVRIELVGEVAVAAQQSASADYRTRGDAEDAEFERLRGRRTDALGTLSLPAGLPADEVIPVKEAVRQYFDAGRARQTEVDAIVPVGTGSRSVLFTIVFGASSNVSVTRIGEAGTAAGMVDVERIDVRRVREFPVAATPAQLRSWWATRYPQGGALVAPATAAAAALITEMNGLVAGGIAAASWFSAVYGMDVLGAGAAATRLETVHGVPAAMLTDTTTFSTADLRMLELSLQTLSTSELLRLRGMKFARKDAGFKPGAGGYVTGDPGQYGYTLRTAAGETTVVLFQPLFDANTRLFHGGSASSALPEVTMRMLHEMGHATGFTAGIEAEFRVWLAAHPQAAPTRFAATAGGAEMFPEVWALYHTDPHFLCTSAPLLFAWLDALATAGSPPARGTTPAVPASCPP